MFKIRKEISPKRRLVTDKELLDLTQKVVKRYVVNGSIPEKEQEDIQMGMVEKFLNKLDDIEKAYKGKAKVSTYCVAVLNNMCCELIRNNLKSWKIQPEEQLESGETSSPMALEKLIIKDEVRLLSKILCLFSDERAKVNLFLAYFYQLIIKEYDVECYDRNYIKNNLFSLFKRIDLKTKGEIFDNLALAVVKAESKMIKADAVRMWLNKVIEKIICRLNGPFSRSTYDKESMQILFEFYYSEHTETIATVKTKRLE